jgi:two-component system NarL family response regulator
VGVSAIINMQPDMKVIAEATNGQQAVAQYMEHSPDVTLLDIRMPKLGGVEAAEAILKHDAKAKLVALSTYGGDEDVRRALDAGAMAYLTKDVLHDELLTAIRTVNAGKRYLPEDLARALQAQESSEHLSEREVEVLALIVRGMANKQIAHSLGIAEATAKNHVKKILHKLGAQDRTQAATLAIQRGIIHI